MKPKILLIFTLLFFVTTVPATANSNLGDVNGLALIAKLSQDVETRVEKAASNDALILEEESTHLTGPHLYASEIDSEIAIQLEEEP